MKQLTFILLLLIIQWANAQEEREIAPDQIKAITYASKSSPSFYIQKGKNSFLYNPQNEMYQFSKRNVHFLNGAKVIKKHG